MNLRDDRSAASELVIAVLGSVVGAALSRAAGTGPWGTLVGAAVLPVISTTFSPRRAGETRRVRAAAIAVLTLVALTITWSGVSLADYTAGRSVLPGPARSKTFPGPTPQPTQNPTGPTTQPPPQVDPPPVRPLVEVSVTRCPTVAMGSTVDCGTARVTYNGADRLHVTRMQITGANPGDFIAGEECVGKWLSPTSRSCDFSIAFLPTSAGERTATLIVHQSLPRPDTGTRAHLSGTATDSGTGTGTSIDPDTCIQGFVWREAFSGDHVCVEPATRAQAAADNAQAGYTRSPAGGAYGPDTCRDGYVWREAAPDDHVCVVPATRDQAARDNELAASRRVG